MLELKGVYKRFGGLVASKNINMKIKEGEFVGIIGPNGAGKTTIFNMISGHFLLPRKNNLQWPGYNGLAFQ